VGALGSRRVAVGAALALGLALWTAGAAPSALLLFLALAVVGAADAAMDIAMNANGAAYERGSGRSLLHRPHAGWRPGPVAGAGLAAGAAAVGLGLTAQLVAIGTVIGVVAVAARSGLVAPDPPPVEVPAIGDGRRPGGHRWALWALAGAVVAGAVVE